MRHEGLGKPPFSHGHVPSPRPCASLYCNRPQALRDRINRKLYSVTSGESWCWAGGVCGAMQRSVNHQRGNTATSPSAAMMHEA